jgi:hypothetical protein
MKTRDFRTRGQSKSIPDVHWNASSDQRSHLHLHNPWLYQNDLLRTMSSRPKAESDLSSISSGLSSVPDAEASTANGKSSKPSKPKSTKPPVATKPKASSAPTKVKKATTTKTNGGTDSGRPEKAMVKPKANGKGKAKALVEEIPKIEKRQRTYGLQAQDLIEYAMDEDIKSEYVAATFRCLSRYTDAFSQLASTICVGFHCQVLQRLYQGTRCRRRVSQSPPTEQERRSCRSQKLFWLL